jgi:predicted transcriptional regulator
MMPKLYQFFSRARSSFAFMSGLAKKLARKKPRGAEFVPQRMCPFCGLITARGKVYCLECGKSFKPA